MTAATLENTIRSSADSASRVLRMAWVCPHSPDPMFGGPVRTYHLIRSIARRHAVDLFVLQESGDVPSDLGELVQSVRFFPPTYEWNAAKRASLLSFRSHQRLATESREFVAAFGDLADYDVVVHEYTRSAFIPFPGDPVRVLNMHNIEHELVFRTAATDSNPLRRAYRWWDAVKLRREERAIVNDFDLVATCSEREMDIVRRRAPEAEVDSFPNGVDNTRFERVVENAEEPVDLLFVGTMNYFPNEHGMLHFGEKIWPLIRKLRPDTSCRIVGVNPTDRIRAMAGAGFKVSGGVPDVRPHYWSAKALIVPLFSGSGTRLKILEAAGAGTPVVSTFVGAEGLAFRNGEEIRIADDDDGFARCCVELVDNRTLASEQAAKATAMARAAYDWEAIGGALCKRMEAAAARRTGGQT